MLFVIEAVIFCPEEELSSTEVECPDLLQATEPYCQYSDINTHVH